ncbi:MAG: hypothetical protein MI867_17610 [Pseudomonadales bacterium]|nr:hypothetical protein [Pseudomonadales bacterium]
MKESLRKVFAPILNVFESGNEPFAYKPSHRKILVFVSAVFSMLAVIVVALDPGEDKGYLFPVIVFSLIGLVGLVVGFLGTDRAVAKIWGSR